MGAPEATRTVRVPLAACLGGGAVQAATRVANPRARVSCPGSVQAGTERAFTGKTVDGSPHDNKLKGVYVSAVGGLPLFSSGACPAAPRHAVHGTLCLDLIWAVICTPRMHSWPQVLSWCVCVPAGLCARAFPAVAQTPSMTAAPAGRRSSSPLVRCGGCGGRPGRMAGCPCCACLPSRPAGASPLQTGLASSAPDPPMAQIQST